MSIKDLESALRIAFLFSSDFVSLWTVVLVEYNETLVLLFTCKGMRILPYLITTKVVALLPTLSAK